MPGMMRRALTIAVALVAMIGMAALAVPATGVAGKGKKAKVTVNDDFFNPDNLKVKKNTKVKFKWDETNLNTHNVTLKKGPKGVKKTKKPCAKGKITKCNKSASGSIGINFAPTFNKKGTYKFVCTIHPTVMQLTVKVKK
jgi:plastocyanin